MPLNGVERAITKDVLDRYLNLKQPTPRRSLVTRFKEPDAIDRLVQQCVLRITLDHYYLPRALAFHYCANVDALALAKSSIVILTHVLQNLFEVELERTDFTPADIEAQARKMYDRVEPETINLGLYLAEEFGLFVGWSRETQSGKILSLRINEAVVSIKDVAGVWDDGVRRLSVYVEGKPEVEMRDETATPDPDPKDIPNAPAPGSSESRSVWVVHGRDNRLREAMFAFLRAIGLQPIEFSKARRLTKKPTPYIGDILQAAFANAQAVVVLLTPDDEGKLRKEWLQPDDPEWERRLTPQARQNVIFEAGMALASHPERTVLVQFGSIRPFSDVSGLHTVRMDNSAAKRKDLAQRLADAGCVVDTAGEEWLTVGNLTPISEPTEGNPAPVDSNPGASIGDETYQLVLQRWEQIKDPALKEAVRFLLREDITTRQALHLLHQKGLGMNFAAVYEGVAETTNLVQRVVHVSPSEEFMQGYTGPWTINPTFKSALQQIIQAEAKPVKGS